MYVRGFLVHINHHERDNCHEVDKSIKGEQVAQTCFPGMVATGILHGSSYDAQSIFDGEYKGSQVVERIQDIMVGS